MNAKEYVRSIHEGKKDRELASLYGSRSIEFQRQRYEAIASALDPRSKDRGIFFFSTPGRTELGGNHTDHNHGKVLAGSVTLDTICAVSKTETNEISITSEGFGKRFSVDLGDLAPKKAEEGTPASLVRGIAARFRERGYSVSGFEAIISSTVPIGAGLSSSASFEVLIASVLNSLCNEGKLAASELALISQYAENNFFGKPCGLMDQLTCAAGGIVSIDFLNPEVPVVKKIETSFEEYGQSLVIVETGSHHADLTHEYASIPEEMKAVAGIVGSSYLADAGEGIVVSSINKIREKAGDRALLRALHFFGDTARVEKQVKALEEKNIGLYLALVNESGNSSWKLLQNCYPQSATRNQGICVALALTELFLAGSGASRVHGSGFGGAIQAYIPTERLPAFKAFIEPVFGTGSVIPLSIRKTGAVSVF